MFSRSSQNVIFWFLVSDIAISRAVELLFLPVITQAILTHIRSIVAEKFTKSQSSQGTETVRAAKMYFIEWCLSKYTAVPVGPELGCQF
jgi:hypothetical protein